MGLGTKIAVPEIGSLSKGLSYTLFTSDEVNMRLSKIYKYIYLLL